MGTTQIIGLTGFIGSGKSEVAKLLVRHRDYRHMKFAEGLKDMLRAIGLTDRHIEGEFKERKLTLLCGKTPRHAMISLGTEWGREMIGEDLWVNVLQRKIESLMRLYGRDQLKIVIDDCRFMNEATMLTDLGGVIWNIQRPGVDAKTNHRSEVEHLLIPNQVRILNAGSLVDLAFTIKKKLEESSAN